MDHITQLKKIRAEAIARLRNSPDFRLAGKLGQLIVELGDTVEDVKIFDDTALAAPVSPIAPLAPVKAEEKAPTFESALRQETRCSIHTAVSRRDERVFARTHRTEPIALSPSH